MPAPNSILQQNLTAAFAMNLELAGVRTVAEGELGAPVAVEQRTARDRCRGPLLAIVHGLLRTKTEEDSA